MSTIDKIRRVMVKLAPDLRDRGRLTPLAPVLTAEDVWRAGIALDALLAENERLREALEAADDLVLHVGNRGSLRQYKERYIMARAAVPEEAE